MKRPLIELILLCTVAPCALGQNRPNDKLPSPIPMPGDRVEASYAIYSTMIPLGETANEGWPHAQWLIRDTTVTVVAPEDPCDPSKTSASRDAFLNPHLGIQADPQHLNDFNEILQDFDAHCHDRISLDPDAWHLSSPVRLLNREEQDEYQSFKFGRKKALLKPEFKGAPALYGFGMVYFNKSHTVALVYATHYCGSLCGEGFWSAFALEDGKWKKLPWGSPAWIS